MKVKFLTKEEQEKVIAAIQTSEKETSGEIKVHIQPKCSDNPYQDAQKWFNKLKMQETEQRNGVLFFVAYKSKKFAVLGDQGINDVVPDDFWEDTISAMESSFKENNFSEGLVAGILRAGEALKKLFPYQKDDVNELSDEISYA